MKIKRGITLKIFILTFCFFSILLIMITGFQSFFFDKLYLTKKVAGTKENLNVFAQEYVHSNWSKREALQRLNYFSEKNSTNMFILDEYGNLKFSDDTQKYTIIFETYEADIYTINMEVAMYLESFSTFKPEIGEEIFISGVAPESKPNEITLLKLKKGGEEFFDEKLLKKYYSMNNNLVYKELRGTIKQINNLPENDGYEVYTKSLLWNQAFKYWLDSPHGNDDYSEIDTVYSSDPDDEINNMIFAKRVKKDYNEELIFSAISLQPIAEASTVMNDYIYYIIVVGNILMVLLASIFSNIISKPLLKLNRVAKKMARLDFTAHSDVRSNDEIGTLSESLNTLSESLNETMTELKHVNNKLHNEILKEKELKQVQKQFVADISHELKTPLGIIRGYAEGIRYNIYQEKKDYYADTIVKETENMDYMLKEMIDLSRTELKSYKISEEEFDISKVIIDVVRRFKHDILHKELVFNIDIEEVIVIGDESKIEQVIRNIIGNAIKYTQKGKAIEIRIDREDELVFIKIENAHEPIGKKELDKIWDRFYRIDKSRNRRSGGVGLGLSIVQNILDLHKSKYGAVNTENGIEFFFSLKSTDKSWRGHREGKS